MQGTLTDRVAVRKFNELEHYLINTFNLDSISAEEIVVHLQRMLHPRPARISGNVVRIDIAKNIFSRRKNRKRQNGTDGR